MLALYRSGRQADALALYREGRKVLVDTLGLEPAPELSRLQEAILRHDPALVAVPPAPARPSLLVGGDESCAVELLAPLARRRDFELLLVRLVESLAELAETSEALAVQRADLVRSGLAARVAAFRSDAPVEDLARLSKRSGVQLALLAVPLGHLRDLDSLAPLLRDVACDVALLARANCRPGPGPVVVAFGGGDNDWAALELGLSLAEAHGTELVIAGGSRRGHDGSRALAAASLAVQRVSDLVARPLILPTGVDAIAQAAKGAKALLLGLPDDWLRRGLGNARVALTESSPAPTLVVRRGLRVGNLAPDERVTRFTWSS